MMATSAKFESVTSHALHVQARRIGGGGDFLKGGGGPLNRIYQQGSLCTDFFPITVYRKCVKIYIPYDTG